jgi:hypothetical protein
MKKYVVISHGRTASNSLCGHLRDSLDRQGIPQEVLNLETPMIWLKIVPDPENWDAIVMTRQDHMAQVLSFITIIVTSTVHKSSLENTDIDMPEFKVEKEFFLAFAYAILAFEKIVFDFKNWSAFKSYHYFEYEEIVKDWTGLGKTLGYNDWTPVSKLHETGWGNVWDKVTNKSEVLEWSKDLHETTKFRYNPENYKI